MKNLFVEKGEKVVNAAKKSSKKSTKKTIKQKISENEDQLSDSTINEDETINNQSNDQQIADVEQNLQGDSQEHQGANSSNSIQPSSPPKITSSKKATKRKKGKTLFEGDDVDLQQLFEKNYIVKDGTWISNCFLQFNGIQPFYPSDYAQKPTRAYFFFDVKNAYGEDISPLALKKRHLPLEKSNSSKKFYLAATGIGKLMKEIQTAKVGGFPKITILAEEKSVTFRKSSDTHYYLGMLINDPNSPLQIQENNDRVAACANCNVMLLRFGFDWVLQRDDLRGSHCPYCKAPLKINYRKGRIIKVDLNLSETGCIVDGGNNQLGVNYHGHAIKTTIWAHGLLYFLQNYQNFFPNKAMGPLKIKINTANPTEITDIEAQTLLNIEWRPIELFPEDFMAF